MRIPSKDLSMSVEEGQQRREIEELRARLAEAEETLEALRQGDVDAVVINGPSGPKVYTLQDADRPYRIIVERMQEGAVTLAADSTILYANRHLALLLRLPLEHIVGQSFERFVATADHGKVAGMLAESTRNGARSEVELRAADGTAVPVYLSMVDLSGEEPRTISGVVTDLTLQKQQNRELAETNAKLVSTIEERERAERELREAQKMEAVGRLTAGIAHDFNNLLMVLSGNLELMQTHAISERLKKWAASSRSAVQRGTRLVEQLLAFSRQRQLRPSAVAINELLCDTEMLLRRAVGEEIRVTFSLGDDLGRCLIDPAEFQATMLNLAINAKDAMAGGGSLTITTAAAQFDRPASSAGEFVRPGSYVMVAVTDTGHGMPAEVRERAFDPFFTTKDVGKGTGLGLSQVFGFGRQSGGHVAIESEVGTGTTVRLYLPRTEALEMPEVSAAICGPKAIAARTVLVVEDNADVRELLNDMLQDSGCDVLQADTGPAALRILDRGVAVDVVVTDVLMPDGMSGLQLADEIRRRLPRVGIVVTSGNTAFTAPASEVFQSIPILQKPFRRDDLLSALDVALKQVRANSAASPA
jgi:PAS domain S-box-containing protein